MVYPVLHFEVLTKDAPAMQRFYHHAFGWRIGPPANDCVTVFTDSSKEQQ
jgi:predicted enzyme related to lactoylglutathione lyase